MKKLVQSAAILCLRPYISLELPGWGKLYRMLMLVYPSDDDWAWLGSRWVRGKLHNYEIPIDLGNWSNRQTFFLRRFYDLPTQLVIKKFLRPGDVFLDVGANEGAMSLLGSQVVGSKGKVIAIEPNPVPREKLEAAIARNGISNISLLPIGLGDEEGHFSLTIPKINSGEATFGRSNYADVKAVECEVRRGENVLTDTPPDLIKIDVEGFEMKVLLGLERTFRQRRAPIVMEMVASHLLNCGSRPQDISSFLTNLSYRPFRIGLVRKGLKHQLALSKIVVDDYIAADVLWLPA